MGRVRLRLMCDKLASLDLPCKASQYGNRYAQPQEGNCPRLSAVLAGGTLHQDEVFEAVRAAMVRRYYRPPVATLEAVLEVEEAIGYSLPPLLRRLFLEVANGGFGPCRGILGVRGDQSQTHPDTSDDLLHVHRALRAGPARHVPRRMLWLLDWGCCIWSLVDCSRPEGQMWVWDPHGVEWDPNDENFPANCLFRQAMTFTEWLEAWLQGQLRYPPVTSDEVIGQLTIFGDMVGRWH